MAPLYNVGTSEFNVRRKGRRTSCDLKSAVVGCACGETAAVALVFGEGVLGGDLEAPARRTAATY